MPYTPTTWVDGGAPAITAAQLNRMETGIDEAHDQLSVAFPMTIHPAMTASSQGVGNNNRCAFLRVFSGGSISKIGMHVTTSTGNISVAVYSNTGTGASAVPGTRLATSGAVACPAVGYAEVSLGATITVAIGDWIAISADAASAFRSMGNSLIASNLGLGTCLYKETAHPAPASNPTTLLSAAGFSFCFIGVA